MKLTNYSPERMLLPAVLVVGFLSILGPAHAQEASGEQRRELYDGVRKGEIAEPFDMDYTRYSEKVSGVVCIAFSRAVVWFYVSLIALLAVLAIVTVST